MTKFELVVHTNGGDPRRYPVNGEGVILGRSADADITVDGHSVSRKHARVWVDRGALSVEYLGSRSGLTVNGARVKTAILEAGDRFSIGDSIVVVAIKNEMATAPVDRQAHIPTPVPQETPRPSRRERAPVEESAFDEVARIFSRSRSLNDLSKRILDAMMESVQAKRGFMFAAPEEEGGEPKMLAFHLRYSDSVKDGPVLSRALVEQCIEESQGRRLGFRRKKSSRKNGNGSLDSKTICAPLMAKKVCVGVVYIDSPKGDSKFSEAAYERVAALGRAAGIALIKARQT